MSLLSTRQPLPALSWWTLLCSLLLCGCFHPDLGIPPSREIPGDLLMVALDGVGYDAMLEAQSRGYFPEFQPPSRLYTLFPSLSLGCFTRLLQDFTGYRNPGYDVWYYDPVQKRIGGGTRGQAFVESHRYLFFFDQSWFSPVANELVYFFPNTAYQLELTVLEQAMHRQPRPQLVYFLSTDAIGHLHGRGVLVRQLGKLSHTLSRIQRRYLADTGRALKVVLFSDHSQQWGHQTRLGDDQVRQALEQAGYHVTTALQKPRDVVMIIFGNVRTGIFHCLPEDRPGVARLLSQQWGMELTAYRQDQGVVVLGPHGSQGRVDCAADRYRYQALQGDPLRYLPVVQELQRKGRLDAEGWGPAQDWLEATAFHVFPDAAHRLCTGFQEVVTFPADVMFSMEPGAMFGPWNLEAGSQLGFDGIKGNHGGIRIEESVAFVASNDASLPTPLLMTFEHALRDTVFRESPPPPPAVPPLVSPKPRRRWH